jgi:DNA polymerase delta subunit 1
LGLPANANSEAIQRAYRLRMSELKKGSNNDAEIQRVEAAHGRLMLSAFSARLKGGVKVDKEVLYADRATFFPWRPRLYLAGTKIMLYSGVAQALVLAWALLSPTTASTQPVIYGLQPILIFLVL